LAGAPPTNLTSFYDELYKRTGTVQQGITTVGQVRPGTDVDPWTQTRNPSTNQRHRVSRH